MPVDRDSWTPPKPPDRSGADRWAGALGGSKLLQQPRYARRLEQLRHFITRPGPLALEIGFDHGINLLANARAFPDWRWLGVEIRRHRVSAVQPHLPDNCMALRLDARILLASVLEAAELDRVDILFPTPAVKGSHLLFTPALVHHLSRCLRPDGVVHIATDVPGVHKLCEELFARWERAPHPPRAPDLSRRERVCQRDGLRVWRETYAVTSDSI